MTIIVTGANGQLGHDVVCSLKAQGENVIPTDIAEMDIRNSYSVMSFISENKPDAIIHLAAWTAVDAAEDNQEDCFNINVAGTRNIAEAAVANNAKVMYISTDYVFSGQGDIPWDPDKSSPSPINTYGESKYEGEQIVKGLCKNYIIVRISWVFGKNGKNFVKTMLDIGRTRKDIRVVNDQIGSPTYTHDLAPLLANMIKSSVTGTFHATNEGYCSWFDIASETFSIMKARGHHEYDDIKVISIPTKEYQQKAKRPLNSRMDCSKLEEFGFTRLPEWKDALNRFIMEIGY